MVYHEDQFLVPFYLSNCDIFAGIVLYASIVLCRWHKYNICPS